MKKIVMIATSFFLSSLVAAANVHVFLLVGQSNMVGRDPTPFNFETDPRVLNFTDGRGDTPLNTIVIANDPLRHDKKGPIPGTNMGRPFAKKLLLSLPAGDKILLVNRAWGGTPIVEWNKSHGPSGYAQSSNYNLPVNPYMTAINDYRAALDVVKKIGDTPIKAGILWLQGESDVDNLTSPEMFRAATYDVLSSMREDIGDPKMKIVIGEFYQGYGGKAGAMIRAQLKRVAKDLNAGFASSAGASVRTDGVHMLTSAHEQQGVRAAEAYISINN